MDLPHQTLDYLRRFIGTEAWAGVLLLIATIAALLVANSGLYEGYHSLLHDTTVTLALNGYGFDKNLGYWINDGLMAVFFFLVGLELKRELVLGRLQDFRTAVLPLVAAVGGIVGPAVVYSLMTGVKPIISAGWAIPTATDIAFAMGILALFGKRIPVQLKAFLLALAMFDDIGAIVIIALFYAKGLAWTNLLLAAFFYGILIAMNRWRVSHASLFIPVIVAFWACVFQSGVHATLAGFLAALTIPLVKDHADGESLLEKLEHDLHPLVAFFILPLFAFANAGVPLTAMPNVHAIAPATIGVMTGLWLGKPLGIFMATWLAVKLKFGKLSVGLNMLHILGVSCLAGVGFTMALFIANLAFRSQPVLLMQAKVGILLGSLLSALMGIAVLLMACRKGRMALGNKIHHND